MKYTLLTILVFVLTFCNSTDVEAQQDPQYTQYMFNTVSVNPAYAGSAGHAKVLGLARTQWVGFDGAPNTQTLSYDSPIGNAGMGIGVNLVNDRLGPSHETYLDANLAYGVETSIDGNLAFGLKLGGRLLSIDWSLGKQSQEGDKVFENNIVNKFLPTIGAGLYYHTSSWYAGVAVPNFLPSEHYDEEKRNKKEVAVERMHFYLIGGYVFDITENIKFKPAFLTKVVNGAPLSLDLSANFMFNERFRAGLSWRWDDSISALLGLQASEALHIGYAYDLTTSNFNVANSGTHELFIRYEIFREMGTRTPRFF